MALTSVPRVASSPRCTSGWLVLACAVLAQTMLMVTLTIVLVALPDIQSALGADDVARTWLITAYTLAYGALVLFGGVLCQRLGLRRSFLVATTGFGLASLLGGFATNFGVLATARALQGGFAAVLAPTNLALVSTGFTEPRRRAGAFAVLGGTGGIGAAAGLLLGGLFIQYLDWRWCLWVNVPLAAVALAAAWRGLRGAARPQPGRVFADPAGLVLSCTGLLALTWSFSQADRAGWADPGTLTSAGCGIVLLVAFLAWQRHASEPVLPLSVLRNPVRAGSNLIMFFAGWAQLGTLAYLTYYLQDNLGYSPLATGLAILPLIAALIVLTAATSIWILPRWGIRLVYPLGAALLAVGFQILATLSSAPGYLPRVLPGLILVGAGMGVALPPAFSAGTEGVPAHHTGAASATLNSAQQLGASFGTALLATWASTRIVATMTANADTIRNQINAALRSAHLDPNGPVAANLAATITDRYLARAATEAYSGGFQILAITGYALTAILIVATRVQPPIERRKPTGRCVDDPW